MKSNITPETRHKIYSYLLSAGITLAYFLTVFFFIWPVYAINDDRAMYRIISGEMTGHPDGHAIFILYPFGWIVSKLFEIIPIIDWYAVIMIGVMCFCLSLLLYRGLCKRGKKRFFYAAGILMIFHILMLEHIVMFQFTIVAAILGGTVIVWIMTMENDRLHKGEILVGVFLIFLTICVRKSVFYMTGPFIVLAFIYKNVKIDKQKIRIKRISAVVLSFVVTIGSLAINAFAYNSEEWDSYLEYNATRSEIFDYYGFPDYVQYQDFYEECGISREEYDCLVSYNLVMDYGENHAEKMEKIAEKAKEIYFENFSTNLKKQIQTAVNLFGQSDLYVYHAFILACMILMFILLFRMKKKTVFLTWLFGAAVYAAEVIYLIFKGRLIDRVVWALDIVFILFMLSFFLLFWREFSKVVKIGCSLYIILLTALACLDLPTTKNDALALKYGNEVLDALTGYCRQREENFYFSFGETYVTTQDARLLKKEDCWNYTGFGGWTAHSPAERDRLERASIENVEYSILNDENVFIIGPDTEMTEKERALRAYLDSKYSDVEWKQVDYIDLYVDDYIVWKVSISS